MKRVALLLFCITGFTLFSKSQSTIRVSDTIPYEIIEKKIILTVKLNNQPAKFIFDTGGVNLITLDSAVYHGIKAINRQVVADVNSKSAVFHKGILQELQLSDNLIISETNVLITPPQAYFEGLGVAGALGGEAFADICVTFCPEEKNIILTHPYRPAGISRNEGIPMRMGNQFSAIVPVKVGKSTVHALFDTGMDGFFHLSDEDYDKLSETENILTIAEGEGIWHVGVSGIGELELKKIRKINISEMTIGGQKFSEVEGVTQNAPVSIIGIRLLEFGKIIMDYPRGLFYFFPNNNLDKPVEVPSEVWNVNILPVKDHFMVSGIIGENSGLAIGERVWDINGASLDSFPLDQVKVLELMDQITTPTAYLLVGDTKENIRKVIIRKL